MWTHSTASTETREFGSVTQDRLDIFRSQGDIQLPSYFSMQCNKCLGLKTFIKNMNKTPRLVFFTTPNPTILLHHSPLPTNMAWQPWSKGFGFNEYFTRVHFKDDGHVGSIFRCFLNKSSVCMCAYGNFIFLFMWKTL